MKSSRPVAAATGATTTTTTNPESYLVVRDDAVVVRSAPFGHNSVPVEFGALAILASLHQYEAEKEAHIEERENRLKAHKARFRAKLRRESLLDFPKTRPQGIFKINYDGLTVILGFLLENNALQLLRSTLPVIAPQHFQMIAPESFPSEQQRLIGLALPLRAMTSRISTESRFFCTKYHRGVEAACLIDAALNADHKKLNDIIAGCTNPDALKELLSATGTATITHLRFERTGTPLQMALYSHDETAFKMLADQMNDPEEVARQCQKVFDDCGVHDYSALIEKQIGDANRLCSELEAAFAQALPIHITNAFIRVAGTTSALQDVLNRFNINLDRYVGANSVHNPYILQRLFEIYDQLPYDWQTECLISQQAIGPAQKLSSARWLQHNAQGICYLGQESGAAAPVSSFSCQGSPVLDMRSHGVLSRLGVDFCIDIFGHADCWSAHARGRPAAYYQNLCRAKTASLENLCGLRGRLVRSVGA